VQEVCLRCSLENPPLLTYFSQLSSYQTFASNTSSVYSLEAELHQHAGNSRPLIPIFGLARGVASEQIWPETGPDALSTPACAALRCNRITTDAIRNRANQPGFLFVVAFD
jgi:hypothetical protein